MASSTQQHRWSTSTSDASSGTARRVTAPSMGMTPEPLFDMPDIIVDSRCLDGRDAVRTTSRESRTLDAGSSTPSLGDVGGGSIVSSFSSSDTTVTP
ncbi:MAG: hypothetical protein M3487_02705 [Actinomycetota bacterium]|nr:hypothetical protein [Actinomycetota bacterium]